MVKRGESYYGLLQAFENPSKLKEFNSSFIIKISHDIRSISMLKLRYNLSVLHHDNRRPFMISKISGFTNTKQFVHFYSTDDAVKELYKDRLAPVKPFTDKVILSVSADGVSTPFTPVYAPAAVLCSTRGMK
jgi:hypothetical protein